MLYLMDGEAPELDNCGFVRYGLFVPTRDQRAIIQGITTEDCALFDSLRDAATEIRDREYDALERLAVLLSGDGGPDVQARWGAAIDRNPEAVEECMVELGWLDSGARGD
jgi:hypothetical protein